jgi:branched-chain amino acid transport system permease protein
MGSAPLASVPLASVPPAPSVTGFPAAAASVSSWRSSPHLWLALIWLAMLAIPFVAPNAYVVSLANMALINLILVASLNLLMGYGGQISLSHAGFFGLGAYASGVLNVKLGVTPWLGLPAAALMTAAAAWVIGLPALRLRGHYLSMATLGWNAILVVLFNQLVNLTGGPNGLLGVQPFALAGLKLDTESRAFPLLWLVSLLVMLAILNLLRSRIGRALRAVATNELGADAVGVDSFRTKLIVFVLSAGMAGIAGSLYVHVNQYASPETFGVATSILLIVVVAIGGSGTYWGPLLGALTYTALPQVLLDYEDAELMLFGLGMLIVLIAFPGGLASVPEAIARAFTRLFALKRPG